MFKAPPLAVLAATLLAATSASALAFLSTRYDAHVHVLAIQNKLSF
jgi:hypothetical protein